MDLLLVSMVTALATLTVTIARVNLDTQDTTANRRSTCVTPCPVSMETVLITSVSTLVAVYTGTQEKTASFK